MARDENGVDEASVDADYEYSRAQYYRLAETGQEAIEMMMEVARESEHPRAYEVLASMLKQNAEITDKLMDLNKKRKDVVKKEEKSTQTALPSGPTNNNLFIGSTTELQRFLLGSPDEKVIEDDDDTSRET